MKREPRRIAVRPATHMEQETSKLVEDERPALALRQSGQIQVGDYLLTRKGLVGGSKATRKNWEDAGRIIFGMEGAIQWLIGDWLRDTERTWGKTYEQIADETGRDKSTLYNYLYVATKVDFSLRHENLSFYHHYAVAKEEPEEQGRLLDLAEQNKWSVAQLRTHMKNCAPTLPTGDDSTDVVERQVAKFERSMTEELKGVGQEGRIKIANQLREIARKIEKGDV